VCCVNASLVVASGQQTAHLIARSDVHTAMCA
jgi:hypothetical protein